MKTRALAVLMLILTWSPDAGADEFEKARAAYARGMRASTLRERTLARQTFARTGDERALALIAAGYTRPESPKARVRILVASMLGAHASTEAEVAVLRALRAKHRTRADAWLWYQALRRECERGGAAPALEVLASTKLDCFLRAAAIEGWIDADAEGDELLAQVPTLLAGLPKNAMERAILTESLARLLWTARKERAGQRFRSAARPLIQLLDAKEMHARTRLTLARYLGRIFETDVLYVSAKPWLRLLASEAAPDKPLESRYATPTYRPTFVGIPATGSRIGYVIDVSGSMAEPLTAEEKRRLRAPPKEKKKPPAVVTGKPDAAAENSKKKPGKKKVPTTADLPWHRIHTRLDAVREFLKQSLRMLERDQAFLVVWFETTATTLKGFDRPVKATPANVGRAIRMLDARAALGSTNMHGGIRLAFAGGARGPVKGDATRSAEALLGGCDTMFILSDGSPNVDDWSPSEAGMGSFPGVTYGGIEEPTFRDYGTDFQLVDDVRRMNLFRKAEIHCVGIGESSRGLLADLARLGHGKVRYIGADGVTTVDPAKTPEKEPRADAIRESELQLLGSLRSDPDPKERALAAKMLADFFSVDAVPPLIDALDDKVEFVRLAASKALRRICRKREPEFKLPAGAPAADIGALQARWRAWFQANEAGLRARLDEQRMK